jgi:hypothetical protein
VVVILINFTFNADSTPPYWNNLVSYPTSGETWKFPAEYVFNITWNDELNDIDAVWIEHNFDGTLANHTVMVTGNNYYYIRGNIPAGNYIYKWYANDTLNNVNQTGYISYTINRASSQLQLLLNGSSSDIDIGEGDSVNITAYLLVPDTGYMELYQDGLLINSGSNNIWNITYYFLQQRYNITAVYPQTQNYSESRMTHFITVTDTSPPTVGLGNPANDTWQPRTVIFYYYPRDNIDVVNCTLIINGIQNDTKKFNYKLLEQFYIGTF